MEARSLLLSFWQLINVLRIAGVQAVSVIFVSYGIGKWAVFSGVRGCGPFADYYSFSFWSLSAVGIAATVLSVFYILAPAIWMQSVDKQLVFSSTDAHIPFLSTRPIYVFLDAVMFVPAIAFFQSGRAETLCQFNFEWAFGWSFLLMALLYPILRAVSWFVFKFQIEAKKVDIPWTTLIMWWIIVIPAITYVTYNYLNSEMFPKLRAPVVNKNTFKGGLEKNPQFMEGIIRVQGTLVRNIAKCGLFSRDPEKYRYPAGTVLLDMGKNNGQIIVKATRRDHVELLEYEAKNKDGQIFEAFGRLSKLPNPNKKLICGIGKANAEQKNGLALLEIELPEQ